MGIARFTIRKLIEYTTYECGQCGEDRPIDQVYDIGDAFIKIPYRREHPSYTKYWVCRSCLLQKRTCVECKRCGSKEGPLHAVFGAHYCSPCVSGLWTIQDELEAGHIKNLESSLGTGEPEEDPDTEAEWRKHFERTAQKKEKPETQQPAHTSGRGKAAL